MKEFKAAIFDLDGTIVDSNFVWERIDRKILENHGISVSDEDIIEMTAMSYEDCINKMQSFGIPDSYDELRKQLDDMAVYEYRNNIFLKEYVKEYFDFLKAKGIYIALATGSPERLYEPVLRHNSVYGYFDALCCTDEAGRDKDYPDIYLLCASKIGVAPEDCLVFEDLLKGVISARNAGMQTVGVYDKFSEKDIFSIKTICDKYIYTFAEMM